MLSEKSKILDDLELHFTFQSFRIKIIWFRVMEKKDQWIIHRHLHSTYELHIVKSGDSLVTFDDHSFYVQEGDFFLTKPGVYHMQTNGDCEHYTEYCINLDIEILSSKHSEETDIIHSFSENDYLYAQELSLAKLFEECLDEAYNQEMGFQTKIQLTIINILVFISRVNNSNQPSRYTISKKNQKTHYSNIERFIEDNVHLPIKATDISEYLFLSEKQVCRVVQEKLGITTKQLIDLYRNEKSKSLLKTTSLSIKEISDYLHFSSPFVFNKFFRRMNNLTPLTFKEMSENDNI